MAQEYYGQYPPGYVPPQGGMAAYPPQPYQYNPTGQVPYYPPQAGAYPPPNGAYPPQPVYNVPPANNPHYPEKSDPSRVAIDMNMGSGAIAANNLGDDGTGSNYLANADKAIRMGFIRKVYTILLTQLAITFAFVAVFTFHEGVREWVQSSPNILISALVVSIVCVIALVCCTSVARKTPGNYICLLIFTLAESYLIGAAASFYQTDSVIKAVVATFVVVCALTAFAWNTKYDFTAKTGLLITLIVILILFGIAAAIWRTQIMSTLYGAIGAFVFSIFIVYDTQMIIGGKHKNKFTVDEYVFAALSLYLDIVNLFMHLLRLMGDRR